MNDDKTTQKAVPSDLSDHDERSESLATEKHWDEESNDAMATAEKRLDAFKKDGVPISAEDWENEDEEELKSEHIEASIDDALGNDEVEE